MSIILQIPIWYYQHWKNPFYLVNLIYQELVQFLIRSCRTIRMTHSGVYRVAHAFNKGWTNGKSNHETNFSRIHSKILEIYTENRYKIAWNKSLPFNNLRCVLLVCTIAVRLQLSNFFDFSYAKLYNSLFWIANLANINNLK